MQPASMNPSTGATTSIFSGSWSLAWIQRRDMARSDSVVAHGARRVFGSGQEPGSYRQKFRGIVDRQFLILLDGCCHRIAVRRSNHAIHAGVDSEHPGVFASHMPHYAKPARRDRSSHSNCAFHGCGCVCGGMVVGAVFVATGRRANVRLGWSGAAAFTRDCMSPRSVNSAG